MKKIAFTTCIIAALIFASCSGSQQRKQEAAQKYEQWQKSLTDSAMRLNDSIEVLNTRVDDYLAQTDSLLKFFTRVNNPRYVEGFTIYKTEAGNYPPTHTALVARMLDSEALELVAVLQGGNFDRISVSNGTSEVSSAVVPYDQALNYREGGRSTVAFSGPEAMDVARFIYEHQGEKLTVSYLNPGRAGSLVLSQQAVTAIAATYQLCHARMEINALNVRIPILQEKVKIYMQKAM